MAPPASSTIWSNRRVLTINTNIQTIHVKKFKNTITRTRWGSAHETDFEQNEQNLMTYAGTTKNRAEKIANVLESESVIWRTKVEEAFIKPETHTSLEIHNIQL